MLMSGGASPSRGDEGKVLALLERGGVFLAGGVLVGTIAFRAYANMLGVTLPGETQTRGIDVAGDQTVPVAVIDPAPLGLQSLQEQSGMGFIPVPSLVRKSHATESALRGSKAEQTIPATSAAGIAPHRPRARRACIHSGRTGAVTESPIDCSRISASRIGTNAA